MAVRVCGPWRRLTWLAPLLTMVAIVGPTAPAHARSACRGANYLPGRVSLWQLSQSTVCLLNEQRRAYGLAPLRFDWSLAHAANRHAADMVAHRYFSHLARSGTPGSRVHHAGYHCSTRACPVGENMAYASGRATPRLLVRMWMNSPDHRANILSPLFRRIGPGVVLGTPSHHRGATYVTDFGG